MDVLTTIFTFITGAGSVGILAYLRYFRDVKVDDRTFNEQELAKYKAKLEQMDAQMTRLEMSSINSTAPEWRKDSQRRYQYVSPSYEMSVLVPLGLTLNDIQGKTDREIFKDYPDFVKTLNSIDDDAQKSPEHITVRRGVRFPFNQNQKVVIKEITQATRGGSFYIGRCYPEELFGK